MSETKQLPAKPTDPGELAALGETLARTYRDAVAHYAKEYDLPTGEAAAKASEPTQEEYLAEIRERSSRNVTWRELDRLFQHEPTQFVQKWKSIKQDALNYIKSDQPGADALAQGGPWGRAQYFAIQHVFSRDWKPRNGIEQNLIDQMAQAYTHWLRWQRIMTNCLDYNYWDGEDQDELPKQLPRVSVAEAVENAGAMADRFNRIYIRTLRALRDLRRYSQPVVVQNVGQVNVGGQQINVARGQSEPFPAE